MTLPTLLGFLSTVRGQPAPDLRKHCARGGTRTAFRPLKTMGNRENVRNTKESEDCTRHSETKSVDNVHTLLWAQFFELRVRLLGESIRPDHRRPIAPEDHTARRFYPDGVWSF